jgi:predicted MPP superfamily phosphohydrolase
LKKTTAGVDPAAFKILLSHDPSHWDGEVLNFSERIPLTLSGHTHGMQFGIEIPGWKWSPVKYRYPRWAGLYQEAGKFLYVNRGFGFLGFPGRVGIWPEVTVITLRKGRPPVAIT